MAAISSGSGNRNYDSSSLSSSICGAGDWQRYLLPCSTGLSQSILPLVILHCAVATMCSFSRCVVPSCKLTLRNKYGGRVCNIVYVGET